MDDAPTYHGYWGKTTHDEADGISFHLFPYHCLDVAAVAAAWWASSTTIRRVFCGTTQCDESTTKAWSLFFIALHDIGKLDFRFQLKSVSTLQFLQPDFDPEDADPDPCYYHGPDGYGWLVRELTSLGFSEDIFDQWQPWLRDVTGHHGSLPYGTKDSSPDAEPYILDRDASARSEFVRDMARFFLEPAGLSLYDNPPITPDILSGFCCVSDWLGSNEELFRYTSRPVSLKEYWNNREPIAKAAIAESGLVGTGPKEGGMAAIYPSYAPRQVQTLINQIPSEPGITLIEAPTGSGKTEAAIALATNLLANGAGEAIIFALPTQATANAMYERLQSIANTVFPGSGILLLAHGRAKYHPGFNALKKGAGRTAQGSEEAKSQCVQWLGASRKRAFLGQIGVCTIDQVFLSVLPVRHQFVRAFGIRKAILIIDEVHAYDAYMYGLLISVIQGQRSNNGSAILLSATLPSWQKNLLLDNESLTDTDSPYPLITHCASANDPVVIEIKDKAQLPPTFLVNTEIRATENLFPDEKLISKIIASAESGALVAVICNLVADAQALAARLCECETTIPVDLFHSRYRFRDRQKIEQAVLEHYGRDAKRNTGRILVATQVVEQSLDLDFDWMVTQLCPIDLLFQRMGRLHRHHRAHRPEAHRIPMCTILVPENDDYGLHECIYEYRRILWRTRKLLEGQNAIRFPEAYREWIERAYQIEPWADEPSAITKEADDFLIDLKGKFYAGKQMASVAAKPLPDTEGAAGQLTRDGEMSLTVVIAARKEGRLCTLEEEPLEGLEDWEADEIIDLNSVGVPQSWRKFLPKADDEGRYWLLMQHNGTQWNGENSEAQFTYTSLNGLDNTDK